MPQAHRLVPLEPREGRRPRIGGPSPWGPIQTIDQVKGSEGNLLFVSTAGHGGFWMSNELLDKFDKTLGYDYPLFAGRPWLEEDCDAALAVIVFPELFDADANAEACKMIMGWGGDYFAKARQYLITSSTGQTLLAAAGIEIPKPAPAAVPFREEHCGGSFDGFAVTSDADPGL